VAAVLAMNAPQTVKQLRLPTHREEPRARSRRDSEVRRSGGRSDMDQRRGRRRDRRGEGGRPGRERERERPSVPSTSVGRDDRRDDRRRDRSSAPGGSDPRRPRPAPPPQPAEPRSLGVVVTGRRLEGGPVTVDRSRSPLSDIVKPEETSSLPRQPMVPRLRPDDGSSLGGRSERSMEAPPSGGRDRDRERGEGNE
jgi:hypothetical protein